MQYKYTQEDFLVVGTLYKFILWLTTILRSSVACSLCVHVWMCFLVFMLIVPYMYTLIKITYQYLLTYFTYILNTFTRR